MNELLFNEEKHEYTLNGKVLISVTQLLEKHGLAPKYDGIDTELLKKRADYGRMIHKEIELYLKNGIYGFSKECQNFIKWFEGQNRYEFRDSELMVMYSEQNPLYAGTIDIVLYDKKLSCFVIVDLKTTSIIHEESVSWQESLYALAHSTTIGIDFRAYKGMVIHLKEDLFEIKEVKIKYEDVFDLLKAEMDGKIFQYEVSDIQHALAEVEKLELAIISQKEEIDRLKKEQEDFKAKIMEEMESRNIKSLETPKLKITIKNGYQKESLDTKKLIEDHPELKDKYLKTSWVEPSILITKKKEE